MWIRSQDKEIIARCNAVLVSPSDDLEYCIYAYCDNDRVYLGDYSTKEKALKVLDYIETFLNEGISGIFQMPQDSEVLENDK